MRVLVRVSVRPSVRPSVQAEVTKSSATISIGPSELSCPRLVAVIIMTDELAYWELLLFSFTAIFDTAGFVSFLSLIFSGLISSLSIVSLSMDVQPCSLL